MIKAAETGGVVSVRRSKRDAVLEEAARRLNARGVSLTSLTDVALALGLTRAALYYYVEDRDDLVFQCYRRACETMARDLDAAAKAPGLGLDRLKAFVERSLDEERPEPAVLSEVASLPSPQRETIEGLHHGNVAQLIDLIEAGLADGSIRPCHPLVVAQAIVGAVSWIPLAPRWTGEPEAGFRERAKAGALTLIGEGVAVDPERALAYAPLDIAILRPERGNLFDRDAAQAKLDAISKGATNQPPKPGAGAPKATKAAKPQRN